MNLLPSKRIWTMPLTLGMFTLSGLLTALLGSGYWYWIAWGFMTVPLLVVAWFVLTRHRA